MLFKNYLRKSHIIWGTEVSPEVLKSTIPCKASLKDGSLKINVKFAKPFPQLNGIGSKEYKLKSLSSVHEGDIFFFIYEYLTEF